MQGKIMRSRRIIGIVAVAVACWLLAAAPAFAASWKSPTKIKTGKTKTINLNGGKKKEKVKFVKGKKYSYTSESGNKVYNTTYKLKVNGKTLKTFVKDANYGSGWTLYWIDINKKDKYKELVVKGYPYGGVEPGSQYQIFRYKGGKLVKLKATYYIPTGNMTGYHTYRYNKAAYVQATSIRTKGNGTLELKYTFDNYFSELTGTYSPGYRRVNLKITSAMKATRPVTVTSTVAAAKAVCAFAGYTYPVSGMTVDGPATDGLSGVWDTGIAYYTVQTRAASDGHLLATWHVDRHGDVFDW
jgi:hypothetical protein